MKSVGRGEVGVVSALVLVVGAYLLLVHVLYPPQLCANGTECWPSVPIHAASIPAAVALRLDVIAGATLLLIGAISLLLGSRFGSGRGRALTALLAAAGAYLLVLHVFFPSDPCRTLHNAICQSGSVIASPVVVWWLDLAVGGVALVLGIVILWLWPSEPLRNG
jgi:hypothetical protein